MSISELKEKVLAGYQITKNDDLSIFSTCDLNELCKCANGTITGNMLTTSGTTIKGDLELFEKMGLDATK